MKYLNRNFLWSMAIHKEKINFQFQEKLENPLKVFNNKKIRFTKKHVHTTADPFLVVEKDTLYIFYESQSIGEKGQINLKSTKDLQNFQEHGCILQEDFHLSYPFVFKSGNDYFMLPESSSSGKLFLYEFSNFPFELRVKKIILHGEFYDSSLYQHDGIWYLFTTSSKGLEIFYTTNILEDSFSAHPNNPICVDSRYERNGGGPILNNGKLVRIAQDCSGDYGKNINILSINKLSPTEYEEEVYVENFFNCENSFNFDGGHHLNMVSFNNQTIIVTDGKHKDYLINKLISPIFKLF